MAKLKSQGGISPELMEQAKAAMLEENVNYSEAEEPSKRSGAGYPSLGGFIDTHFNLSEGESLDFSRCQRPDGSFYGTGGTCRKGSPAGAKEQAEKKGRKSRASGGESGGGGGGGSLSKADSFDLRSTMKGNSGSSEKEKASAEKELRRRMAEHEKKGYKKSDAIDSAKKTLARYEKFDKEAGRKTSEGTRQAVGKLEYALDQAT